MYIMNTSATNKKVCIKQIIYLLRILFHIFIIRFWWFSFASRQHSIKRLLFASVLPYEKYVRGNKYLPKNHENIWHRVVTLKTFLFDSKSFYLPKLKIYLFAPRNYFVVALWQTSFLFLIYVFQYSFLSLSYAISRNNEVETGYKVSFKNIYI